MLPALPALPAPPFSYTHLANNIVQPWCKGSTTPDSDDGRVLLSGAPHAHMDSHHSRVARGGTVPGEQLPLTNAQTLRDRDEPHMGPYTDTSNNHLGLARIQSASATHTQHLYQDPHAFGMHAQPLAHYDTTASVTHDAADRHTEARFQTHYQQPLSTQPQPQEQHQYQHQHQIHESHSHVQYRPQLQHAAAELELEAKSKLAARHLSKEVLQQAQVPVAPKPRRAATSLGTGADPGMDPGEAASLQGDPPSAV